MSPNPLHGPDNSFLKPLWVELLGLVFFTNVAASCPSTCFCQNATAAVQCRVLPPQGIPHWVQNLSLAGSNLTVLRASAFRSDGSDLSNLTTLVLTHSNIQAIEPNTFLQLPGLTTLDLSFNALSSLSNGTFAGLSQLRVLKVNQALREPARTQFLSSPWAEGLRNLQTLEIAGNDLPSFPRSILDMETLRTVHMGNNSIKRVEEEVIAILRERKVQVYLSPNPIVCDCKIHAMLLWIRNTSQTLDAHSLLCAAPATLNGTPVTSLSGENLKCVNEDLETASYVFFGIVLALIGVIFLMVLYLNRRGIKRWLNNFREACRDQMEGYHYRYEQDSDPRRSNASTGI